MVEATQLFRPAPPAMASQGRPRETPDMKAFVVSGFDGDGPSGAQAGLVECPAPVPGPGQVAIEVAACGLNFADLLMLKGRYQDTPPLPFILGMEVAGTIIAHGPGVSTPKIGTRVCAFTGQGGLAEVCVLDAARCVEIPPQMPFAEAAAFLIAYGTSHLALTLRARLQPGERLLVLGAGGGVGLTAVELGTILGAEVIAVARGADKCAAARAAGATHVLDGETEDLRSAIKALGGADVVYDAVGGESFTAAMRATNPGGRILVIGFASGDVPHIPANHLLVKNIDVLGVYWGGYLKFHQDALTQSLTELMSHFDEGVLHPHLGATYPFASVDTALSALYARKVAGKIVVSFP